VRSGTHNIFVVAIIIDGRADLVKPSGSLSALHKKRSASAVFVLAICHIDPRKTRVTGKGARASTRAPQTEDKDKFVRKHCVGSGEKV
jgi:hypothetical protein